MGYATIEKELYGIEKCHKCGAMMHEGKHLHHINVHGTVHSAQQIIDHTTKR